MLFSLTFLSVRSSVCPGPNPDVFTTLPFCFLVPFSCEHAVYLALLFQAFSAEKQDTEALCYVLAQALQEFLKSRDLCIEFEAFVHFWLRYALYSYTW